MVETRNENGGEGREGDERRTGERASEMQQHTSAAKGAERREEPRERKRVATE